MTRYVCSCPQSGLKLVTQNKFRILAVWRSRNGVGHINEVTLHRACLVLGWVTILWRAYHLGM